MSHLSLWVLFDPDLVVPVVADLADGSDLAASRSGSEDLVDLDALTVAAAFFASAIHSARNLMIFLWRTTTAVISAKRQMMMATMASRPDMIDGSLGGSFGDVDGGFWAWRRRDIVAR